MESSQVVTVLVAVIAAVGTTLVSGLLARPKTKADARATEAGGQVAVSADAREWAKQFAERAQRAEERADAAEERADQAEATAALTARKMEQLELKFEVGIRYIRGLREEMVVGGLDPAPIPPALIPPLTHDIPSRMRDS